CSVVLKLPLRDFFKVTQIHSDAAGFPYAKQFLRQCFLMMGAAASDGLNPVVDRGMGSSLGTSSVSKLDYALRLCAIPETLTSVALPVLLSHWAKISSSDNKEQLQQSVWRGVTVVIVLMVPFLIGFYIFRTDIVALLYGHGRLSVEAQSHIASLLGVYLIGMLPRLISRLLIRAHLACQNHLTVVTTTLIRLVLNPFLNWIFMQYWGLEGIAWSTALLSYPILAYIAIEFWRKN
ncbi:MAG: oligosaccharide flippase family protein, partial [Candidatus Poribacteria bacterium]|nr:oligosaccharide flippase family protein [Candidatus Poribacteria bacterium]